MLVPVLWGIIGLLALALLSSVTIIVKLLGRAVITKEELDKALKAHRESCDIAGLLARVEARLAEGDKDFRRGRKAITTAMLFIAELCRALHPEVLDCDKVREATAAMQEV